MFITRSRSARPLTLVAAVIAVACHRSPSAPSTVSAQPSSPSTITNFKVATWNVRSGMGIAGFTTTAWDSNTTNCTDPSKPMNAWGVGLPQAELARIRSDASIVALAIQEAWACATPSNVNSVVGFKETTREQNGTALLARYGFSGEPTYILLSSKGREEDWLIGGRVCLNASCSESVPIFSTHWSSLLESARRTVEVLRGQPTPHLFMGDLNVYKVDMWNPSVPCTGSDDPSRVQALGVIEAAAYIDAWKTTQSSEGWTGMATRKGCGIPNGNLFKRIDYVFSTGLRAVSTTRFARAAPGADSPSDHVGLIAELSAVQ